jgi:hypothetical protein
VTELLSKTGHALTVEDFDSVTALDKAADAVVSGPADKADSIYAFPLIYGGEVFCAPSIGKQIFWEEQVAKSVPEKWLTCALLWLLTCEEVPDDRGPAIIKAAKRWGRKCDLTDDEIKRVFAVYNADNEEGDGSNNGNFGEIISLLVREFGKDCKHWMNAPEAEVNMLLADWTRRQEQKAAAYRKSSAGSKNPLPPLPSPKIKALKAFRELADALEASWQKRK